MRIYRFVSLLLLVWVIVGCRQSPPTPTPTPTTAIAAATPAPTTPPTPLPSPTPTATLVPQPLIRAGAQEVGDDGLVVIASVFAPDGGWLVLHDGDTGGPVLARTLVNAGSSNAITLTIDPLAVSNQISAVLHADAAPLGSFDSQTDLPLTYQGEIVANLFPVTVTVALPGIIVSNQTVAADGLLHIDQVIAAAPGFVAVSNAAGQLLGFFPVGRGTHTDVPVRINWRQATPDLLVTLYQDQGTATRFEADDPPVLVDGRPVAASFHTVLPLDVYVFDQPVINDQIVIERVVSEGPGWVVVYFNDDGQPGNIIGYASLADGVNERVVVPVAAGAVTAILHVRLHADTGEVGAFDFPAADPPLTDADGRLPLFSFRIDQGNFLLTRDQVVTDTAIVPLVAANVDTWLVIQADVDGRPGAVIGRVRLPAGMAWDVAVSVDAAAVTPTLYAALIRDDDPAGEFNYPDGGDKPLTQDGNPIFAPFAAP